MDQIWQPADRSGGSSGIDTQRIVFILQISCLEDTSTAAQVTNNVSVCVRSLPFFPHIFVFSQRNILLAKF